MNNINCARIVIHAPNVHQGGGLVLLQELLTNYPALIARGIFDARIKNTCFASTLTKKHCIKPTLSSRLYAEWKLWMETEKEDITLCFNGLPPLFPLKGKVVIFIQNKILLDDTSLVGFSVSTAIRLKIERSWLRMMHHHAYRYIVQTPSMRHALQNHWRNANVSVLPFAPVFEAKSIENEFQNDRKFDFLYVASGESHKNHLNLLDAWRILADADLRPSLALTVSTEAFPQRCAEITKYTKEHSLDITNLNLIEFSKVHRVYQSASALIFPSTTESFGLPLIEAKQFGLPILASELDYVRDVVEPVETFDPNSPVSIARAVRRFLSNKEETIKIKSAKEFLEEILA